MKPKFDSKFNLTFDLYYSEKTYMLSDYSALYNEYELFSNWMNDPNVPEQDKAPYQEMLINVLLSLSFMVNLMNRCGITNQEIEEYQKIPF